VIVLNHICNHYT